MTEKIFKGVFSLKKVTPSGNYTLLIGKLEEGNLAVGWKALVDGKVAEVTDISISSTDRETVVVTVRGVTSEDLDGYSLLEFKTRLL